MGIRSKKEREKGGVGLTGSEGKHDIVYVVIDAARTDGIGHLNSSAESSPTPNIDKLAKSGISFPNAYSCINTTDPSVTSISTGNYPATLGLVHHGKKVTKSEVSGLNDTFLLQEILSEKGYSTAAVDWLGRWHKRGFDQYTGTEGVHDYAEESSDGSGWKKIADWVNTRKNSIPNPVYEIMKKTYRKFINPVGDKHAVEDAETTTDLAIELLKSLDSPKYLFVHYWDAHAPYNTPEKFLDEAVIPEIDYSVEEINNEIERIQNDDRRRYIKEILEEGVKNALKEYYGALSYIDQELGRLLKEIPDDSYVVVMADHGESLVEHGIFFEHHGLYDLNTHVPVIINGPQVPDKPTEGFIQLCDITPTILGELGLNISDMDGINLFSRIRDDKELRERVFIEEAQTQRKQAIRTREYKYIETLGDGICSYCKIQHGEEKELFDLKSDPGEKRNIIEKDLKKSEKLRNDLQSFFAQKREIKEKKMIRKAIKSLGDEIEPENDEELDRKKR